MNRLGRREDRWFNARQRDDHAHQLAALDAAIIRTFGRRVAARMLLGALLAVAILHCWLGHGIARSQSRADRSEGDCNSNQASQKEPIHAAVLQLHPPSRQVTSS